MALLEIAKVGGCLKRVMIIDWEVGKTGEMKGLNHEIAFVSRECDS